jgi:small subunit ribosomal protein S7
MPRRKKVDFRRLVGGDPKFGSSLVHKMINVVMRRGKKGVASAIVYQAIDSLVKKAGGNDRVGYTLFEKAVEIVKPTLEVKSRRVGGGVYQVPMEVRPERALMLALRWLVQSAKARNDKTMGARLAGELMDAVEGKGGAVKKRGDVHRMAEANRAFSHYAW